MGALTTIDKEKVKRVIPKLSNKIIDATVARLYIAYPNADEWTYTGLSGAIVFCDDLVGHTFFLKLVDIIGNRGVLWDQELYVKFEYNQDRSFFHTFEIDDCYAGLLFENVDDASHFLKRVQNKSKHGSKLTINNKNAILLQKKVKEQPQQLGPRGYDNENRSRRTKGPLFYDGLPPPEWRSLYKELEQAGITSEMIADNRDFIKDYISKQGGPLVGLEPPIPRKYQYKSKEEDTYQAPPSSSPSIKHKKKAPPPPPSQRQNQTPSPFQNQNNNNDDDGYDFMPPEGFVSPPTSSSSPSPSVTPTPATPTTAPLTPAAALPALPAAKFRVPPPMSFNNPPPTTAAAPPLNNGPPMPPLRLLLPPPLNRFPQLNQQRLVPPPPPARGAVPLPPPRAGASLPPSQLPPRTNFPQPPPRTNGPVVPQRTGPPPPPPRARGAAPPPPPARGGLPPLPTLLRPVPLLPLLPPRTVPLASNGYLQPLQLAYPQQAYPPQQQAYPQPPLRPAALVPQLAPQYQQLLPPPAPPLPALTSALPPPAPPLPQMNSALPPAPPLPAMGNAPPAPPPPAMSQMSAPAPVELTGDLGRDALLASIRGAGLHQLKKVDKSQLDKPSVLLQEAKGEPVAAPSGGSGGGLPGQPASLADALNAALAQRKGKVSNSDDDDDGDW